MTDQPTPPKRAVERDARIEWLRKNILLWKDINPAADFRASRDLIKRIATQLHHEGLYSPKTLLADVEMGVFKLIRKMLKGKIH